MPDLHSRCADAPAPDVPLVDRLEPFASSKPCVSKARHGGLAQRIHRLASPLPRPGLSSPLPHLRRDWVHPFPHRHRNCRSAATAAAAGGEADEVAAAQLGGFNEGMFKASMLQAATAMMQARPAVANHYARSRRLESPRS